MKFHFSENLVIDSDAEPFCREGLRIGNFGGPGSGKSFNNSLLIEQFLQQGGTVVIFQPRDEYFTLKEKFDILSVGGVHAKDVDFALTAPLTYAKAVVENGISMIFYTSDVEDEAKLVDWVARFLHAIMKLQETYHRPLMILPEESQEYLPNSTAGHIAPPWVYNRMIKAFKDCSTQGRKLNILPVVSSQRPQEVNFTVRQLLNVTFYGKFASHDTKYLDKEVLDTVRKNGVEIRAEQLTRFGKGEWFVVLGSQGQFVTVTQQRLTKHGADTPSLEYIAPRANEVKQTIDELAKSIMTALEKEHAEESELEQTKRKLTETQKKLAEAEKSAQIKLSVKEMMEGPGDTEQLKKLEAELVEFRSGKKLPEAIKQRIELLEADKKNLQKMVDADNKAHNEMCQEISELEDKLAPFEDLKKALAAIMPSMALGSDVIAELKKIAADTAKSEVGALFSSGRPTGSAVSVAESVPTFEVKLDLPIVSMDETSREGQLIIMAYHGYFDEKRRLKEIGKELDRRYVFPSHNLGRDLVPVLERLTQKKVLRREEAPGGDWLYCLFEGAKDRIKEAH